MIETLSKENFSSTADCSLEPKRFPFLKVDIKLDWLTSNLLVFQAQRNNWTECGKNHAICSHDRHQFRAPSTSLYFLTPNLEKLNQAFGSHTG